MQITYPENLPVCQRRFEIAKAIKQSQVVIVCGDTGSGKTTQLPKILSELGYGKNALIGCTQPRRLAAVSVANRLAEEMGVGLGQEVGYQVRFDARVCKKTQIKFMTDGILLAETRANANLSQYDAIIVDEAHERSLNIDFTLGYLKQLLLKRPKLKIVISSATLDAQGFAEFFNNAPIITVQGRTYPVEDFFLPAIEDGEELASHLRRGVTFINDLDSSGDILIFLPGEREINDCMDVIKGMRLKDTDVLALYGRLEMSKQQQVFKPMQSKRRIILATNVAETSLTIPRIRYVIDSGLVRLSRYSSKNHVQRLQVEMVSKASAKQRRGRCGRLSDGICVKLYSQAEFDSFKEFTDPEIRRTSLAGVILQMLDLGIGNIEDFPFLNPPQHRLIQSGYKVLSEVGAVEKHRRGWLLSSYGKTLAHLPLDPHIGRMAIEASKIGVLNEVVPLLAFLSIQDPRERPSDNQEAADKARQKWLSKGSDFIAILNMWRATQEVRQSQSKGALKKFYRQHFLNWRRMQEWHNLYEELFKYCKELKWHIAKFNIDKKLPEQQIHRAILSGIPKNVGVLEDKFEYLGMANRRFFVFPGSNLARKKIRWIMSFSLVETSRLFGRDCAEINPAWIEEVAPHLCKYRYSAPAWSNSNGAVYARETVLAGGLTIVSNRQRHYGGINPVESREIFIREALTTGKLRSKGDFLKHNKNVVEKIIKLEHKLRRVDSLVVWESIFNFFDLKIPQNICTLKAFEKWRKQIEVAQPDFLCFNEVIALGGEQLNISEDDYPDYIVWQNQQFDLRYTWAPGEVDNGIVLTVDIAQLNVLKAPLMQWLVAGYRRELLGCLLKSLPKSKRSKCVPHQQTIEVFLNSDIDFTQEVLVQLCWFLKKQYNLIVDRTDFDLSRIPDYLIMKIEVVDDNQILAVHHDLDFLTKQLKEKVQKSFAKTASKLWHRSKMTSWECQSLPEKVELPSGLCGYPALIDEGQTVGLKLFEHHKQAKLQHRLAQARLFCILYNKQLSWVESKLFQNNSTMVYLSLLCKRGDFKDNLRLLLADTALNGYYYDADAFKVASEKANENLYDVGVNIQDVLINIVKSHKETLAYDIASKNVDWLNGMDDIKKQAEFLFGRYFPLLNFYDGLQMYPWYLRGLLLRCNRLKQNPAKDALKLQELIPFREDFLRELNKYPTVKEVPYSLLDFGWILEDFRLSLLTPEVKPRQKVSIKRLLKAWHLVVK